MDFTYKIQCIFTVKVQGYVIRIPRSSSVTTPHILGDPGADSEGEGKFKRAEK